MILYSNPPPARMRHKTGAGAWTWKGTKGSNIGIMVDGAIADIKSSSYCMAIVDAKDGLSPDGL